MTLPQVLVDLMKLLFDMAVPAAICTMVLAGVALRQEGGVNFQAGGHFQRWALWSVILLTLPQFLSWFAAQGISMPPQGGNINSPWVASVETSFNGFVSNVVVANNWWKLHGLVGDHGLRRVLRLCFSVSRIVNVLDVLSVCSGVSSRRIFPSEYLNRKVCFCPPSLSGSDSLPSTRTIWPCQNWNATSNVTETT